MERRQPQARQPSLRRTQDTCDHLGRNRERLGYFQPRMGSLAGWTASLSHSDLETRWPGRSRMAVGTIRPLNVAPNVCVRFVALAEVNTFHLHQSLPSVDRAAKPNTRKVIAKSLIIEKVVAEFHDRNTGHARTQRCQTCVWNETDEGSEGSTTTYCGRFLPAL